MSTDRTERLAAEELLPTVYEELRALAGGFLGRERVEHTLQPTALVHEAFLRVNQQTGAQWKNPGHLRAVCAQAMRQVLVDHARRVQAEKRGGGERPVTLESNVLGREEDRITVLDLEAALQKLAGLKERQARIVELRFFGGLTHREVASVLGVSETTIEDDWRIARAWLGRELAERAG